MFHCKWKKTAQGDFLIRIGHCLEKGYNLSDAIHLQMYEQPLMIQQRVSKMLKQLQSGHSVSDVFQNAGFPKDSCSFLYFSIQTGELSHGFYEGGRFLKLKEAQKEKFNRLMRYPLFLIWIFGIMVYIVLEQLLPNFKQLYQAMSIELPGIVKFLLSLPSHFGTLFLVILIAIVLMTMMIIIYVRHFSLQQRLKHLLKIPFLSSLLRMYLSYYLAFHLGGLLKVGLSVSEALILIEKQDFQQFFKEEATRMRKSLVNGLALADFIKNQLYYTTDLPAVIRNGEIRGHLGETLQDYSHLVFTHLEDKITHALATLQPLFFILFGGLVIGLFLSILTPMFSILQGL